MSNPYYDDDDGDGEEDDDDIYYVDYDDSEVSNDFSGVADNLIQARDIYGDVNFYEPHENYYETHENYHVTHENYYDGGDETVDYYTIPVFAQPAVFLALFLGSSSYSYLFATVHLSVFDWLKLLASTIILLPALASAYYWSAGGVFERRYRYFRLFIALLVIILAYKYGSGVPLVGNLSKLVSGWLIWRF